MFRVVTARVPGSGLHHSGWPWVVQHIKDSLGSSRGVLLDDFIDRTSTYSTPPPREYPYDEPFVAIFHHPAASPPWLKCVYERRAERILASGRFQRVKNNLRLAVALSMNLADFLRPRVECPVAVLRHPIQTSPFCWRPDIALQQRRVVQLGYYGRNTQAIWHLRAPDWHRLRVKIDTPTFRQHDQACIRHYATLRTRYPEVHQTAMVAKEEYDQLICSSVVFCEILASSANNVVLECMIRDAPILVNRHPAVEEYLGKAYPLFYDSIDEAAEMLTDRNVLAAHEYLSSRDKTPWKMETFIDGLSAL